MTTGRRLCEVRQASVWSPTGIPVQRPLPQIEVASQSAWICTDAAEGLPINSNS